jgi:uncharacterized membrane protein
MTRVLAAGESWISETTHYKGFDKFTTVTYHSGIKPLRRALVDAGFDLDYLPAHEVPSDFPSDIATLAQYDVVILSDIGANSLLLHPDTWLLGKRTPNRLRLLADWVAAGGGLMMAGGYLSFQGFEAKAAFRGTPVEEVLPSEIAPWDDRVEVPDGAPVDVKDPAHPVLAGVSGEWPTLLGYNRFGLKPDAVLLASVGGDPLLAVRNVERGRSLVWSSDIAPHWCPQDFLDWPGYARVMRQAVSWLAGGST